jgi:hypothetical protein
MRKPKTNMKAALPISVNREGKVKIKVEVKLTLHLTNSESYHVDVWGSAGIASPFLTSMPDGEWSASCPGPFTSRERPPHHPQYTLDRRLGEPHSPSGHCAIDQNILSLPGIKPQPSKL